LFPLPKTQLALSQGLHSNNWVNYESLIGDYVKLIIFV
jgi:hypothetical protein